MQSVRNSRGQLLFEQLVKQKFELAAQTARNFAADTAQRHNDEWRSRFGNLDMMTDATGGPAAPLSARTIRRKGHADPLIDFGQDGPYLVNSLYVDLEDGEGSEYRSTFTAFSLIKNWKFPLNEWPVQGRVPARKTLGPTNVNYGDFYTQDLTARIRSVL